MITRHDRPVARMVPEGDRRIGRVMEAVEALEALRGRVASRARGRPRLSAAEVRSAIEEGRR